jgi:serine/threonine-protein kinase
MSIEHLSTALADRSRIERELGAGGMATVYLAHDLRHDRQVALKVLRSDVASELSAERFGREIRLAARLNHPNILPLFDSGEADGFLYFVMPLVEGESLRDRLNKTRQLAIDEVIQLATEVASALDYAHRHEVIHRDVKPENILLHDGHAVVADFGIGKAISAATNDTTLTQTGLSVGTPAYMSPEQAVGEDIIDGRSDLYSLGCVLYELLTGEQPFTGATAQAVIAKRFVMTPPDVTTSRSSIPAPLALAVKRLLSRTPVDRYPTGAALIETLRLSTTSARLADADAVDDRSIAVLPFANMSADPEAEYFSDGMTEEILNALAKLSGLRVMARTSSFAFKGQHADVREIGRKLGVRYLLEGSVRKGGDRIRITAQLIDARDGHHLWSERYDRDMKDVFAVQDEITGTIRDELAKRLLGIGSVESPAQPIDPETYQMFLRGRHLLVTSIQSLPRGMELLKEVIQRAPEYAPAHTELSVAYASMTWNGFAPAEVGFPAARKHAEQALRIEPRNARAHAQLAAVAFFADWDWVSTRHHLDRALACDPDDIHALAMLGFYYSSGGVHDAALRASRSAARIDPLNVSGAQLSLAMIEVFAGDYATAISTCERIIELAPGFSEGYRWRGVARLFLRQLEEARQDFTKAAELSGRHQWSLTLLIRALSELGRLDEARELMEELVAQSRQQHVTHLALSAAAWLQSPPDRDIAFQCKERMVEAREFWSVMFRVDPIFQWLRDDPRYEPMARRIGIPTALPA